MPISPTPPSGRKTSSAPWFRHGCSPRCVTPAASPPRRNARRPPRSFRRAPPSGADHEAAILVDRLEDAAHDLSADAAPRTRVRRARRRATASARGCATEPAPASHTRQLAGPGVGERQKQRPASTGAPERAATSPDRARPSGCATTLTPMPTATREAPAAEHRRLEQDAGELGAVERARRSAI